MQRFFKLNSRWSESEQQWVDTAANTASATANTAMKRGRQHSKKHSEKTETAPAPSKAGLAADSKDAHSNSALAIFVPQTSGSSTSSEEDHRANIKQCLAAYIDRQR